MLLMLLATTIIREGMLVITITIVGNGLSSAVFVQLLRLDAVVEKKKREVPLFRSIYFFIRRGLLSLR